MGKFLHAVTVAFICRQNDTHRYIPNREDFEIWPEMWDL